MESLEPRTNATGLNDIQIIFLYIVTVFYCSFSMFLFIAEKVNELQELLSKKDEEMKAMEAKYKKYLEKAKSVSSFRNL